ncbi:hypothetical protein [Halorubrum aethiopicum]|uniref:hypothetical protein n=1 Tax=Halorubrum aethiopicum TaxID=1758255 RepID=UPI00082EF3DA|nr:hypothetical protein [Halorubrum aethiopicum]
MSSNTSDSEPTDHDPSNASSVQPEDTISVAEAIDQRITDSLLERVERDNRSIEAVVRNLIAEAENALAGDSKHDAGEVLETIHYFLIHDDRIDDLLSPYDDTLDTATKIRFEDHRDTRAAGQTPPPKQEFQTQVQIAKALRYIYSYANKTRYLPVRMELLDIPGATSPVEGDPTPIGRRRVGKDETLDELSEEITISHEDCEHALVIALPRKGKDSTITSICGNLKDEHGYKWFSCLDDGRNETPMTAIPNDEAPIKENLAEFGQEPKAYDSEVFVPDTAGVPEVLPSNFTRFTIGIDDLTPRLIIRLAGLKSADSNTMRRIGQALSETLDSGQGVEHLVERLQEYSEELEATITVTDLEQDEFADDTDRGEVTDAKAVEADPTVREVTYEMDADKALNDAAESLLMLAGEGLIAGPDATTNLDIGEVFRDQDRVAVLNCNFLKPRNEALKYIVLNLWLRLIFRKRDENSRLPRALLEIRELKDIAPSVIGNAKYKTEVKALQTTIYEIATRGGSRRVMMLGSTQKLNDVYKPVRTNMPIKILLQLGEEEIMTLDRSYNFSPRQKEQLASFNVGWGMLINDGDEHWPINWRGARCGLGLGDEHWRDRYAKAWGARVYEGRGTGWITAHRDKDVYINTRSGYVKPIDVENDNLPENGEWHLLWEDIRQNVPVTMTAEDVEPPGPIPTELIETAIEGRRDATIRSDLSLTRDREASERSLSFQNMDDKMDEEKRRVLDENNVPKPLEMWIGKNMKSMRSNMIQTLEGVQLADPEDLRTLDDVADQCGIPKGTIGRWRSERHDFAACMERHDNAWKLTKVGHRAIQINWEKLDRLIG